MDPVAIWLAFEDTLAYEAEEQTAYVYRLDDHDNPVRPFWFKTTSMEGLQYRLAGEGGEFLVMIRRRRTLVFSGRLRFSRRHLSTKT